MSGFVEWEDMLRRERDYALALAELEHIRAVAKADHKRAQKRVKVMKKARPALYRPDRPVSYTVVVNLFVRPVGAWVGEEPTVEQFIIAGTMSESQAVVQALGKAKELGLLYVGTESTQLVTA